MAIVTRAGIVQPPAGDVERWRDEFSRFDCVRIAGLLAMPVLDWIKRSATADAFALYHHDVDPPSVDYRLADQSVQWTLFVMLNDSSLFRIVRDVTGCPPIGCCMPTMYRMGPGPANADTWHDDVDGRRMIGMSVNIGGAFDGGVFQIRRGAAGPPRREIANVVDGDAVLFRIGRDLEHRVTEVTGAASKIALVGWFQDRPHALAVLKSAGRPVPGA